ncbi:unnamed protein product [Rotaria sp. Silwood1]|nr:unnamed protein product [Rotaria sp. Silwood1]CAF1623559.1 unnamed protein product [Rotaria sp. Silwood1]
MVFICNYKSISKKDIFLINCFTIFIIISFIIGFRINISPDIRAQFIQTSSIFKFAERNLNHSQTNITTNVSHQSIESFICNNTNISRFPISSTTPTKDSFEIYRKISLEKYCNKLPIPQDKWLNSQTYTENDIIFIILTSSEYYHTQATIIRDTWLSRITNYYFLSTTPYPYLPVTIISDVNENKLSNMKKLFYGLQIIYQQQMNISINQRQKWFHIANCDTFIIPHYLLKHLNDLDYTKPILLDDHLDQYSCPTKNHRTFTIESSSDGTGIFLSMKLLEIMQPHLINYIENIWPNTSELFDVALSCLANELGVKLTKKIEFSTYPSIFTLVEDKYEKFHNESESNSFHYIKSDEIYELDEFYIHQHMDRLIYDQNWNEFIPFIRRFMASHYELLRKKRRECTLPKVGNPVK